MIAIDTNLLMYAHRFDLGVSGVRVFDLQIGLCALDGGAAELWSHDGAFVRIPGLMTHDPLASRG